MNPADVNAGLNRVRGRVVFSRGVAIVSGSGYDGGGFLG
jgi:hypothetical protein